jgi:hypothetical protein
MLKTEKRKNIDKPEKREKEKRKTDKTGTRTDKQRQKGKTVQMGRGPLAPACVRGLLSRVTARQRGKSSVPRPILLWFTFFHFFVFSLGSFSGLCFLLVFLFSFLFFGFSGFLFQF